MQGDERLICLFCDRDWQISQPQCSVDRCLCFYPKGNQRQSLDASYCIIEVSLFSNSLFTVQVNPYNVKFPLSIRYFSFNDLRERISGLGYWSLLPCEQPARTVAGLRMLTVPLKYLTAERHRT